MPSPNVRWYGTEVTGTVVAALLVRVKTAALMVEGEAKRSMVEPKTGRIYPKPYTKTTWQASAPGEAPAKRTGTLQSSITHTEPTIKWTKIHCYVGTDEPYSGHLELGTVKMEPRPFLRPALDKVRKLMPPLFKGPIS